MNRISYSVKEVSVTLGVGRTTVYKLISAGDLRRVKIGARTVILAQDVDTLLARQAA